MQLNLKLYVRNGSDPDIPLNARNGWIADMALNASFKNLPYR